jgi:hypothetical protein
MSELTEMISTVSVRHRKAHFVAPEALNLAEKPRAKRSLFYDPPEHGGIVEFSCFAVTTVVILVSRYIIVSTVCSPRFLY